MSERGSPGALKRRNCQKEEKRLKGENLTVSDSSERKRRTLGDYALF